MHWIEGLTFFQSDRRSEAKQFRVEQIDWLTLNHRVQLFKEVEIVGMHRVENEIASLHKRHVGRVVFLRERIETQTVFVVGNRLIRFALIVEEGSQNQPVGMAG